MSYSGDVDSPMHTGGVSDVPLLQDARGVNIGPEGVASPEGYHPPGHEGETGTAVVIKVGEHPQDRDESDERAEEPQDAAEEPGVHITRLAILKHINPLYPIYALTEGLEFRNKYDYLTVAGRVLVAATFLLIGLASVASQFFAALVYWASGRNVNHFPSFATDYPSKEASFIMIGSSGANGSLGVYYMLEAFDLALGLYYEACDAVAKGLKKAIPALVELSVKVIITLMFAVLGALLYLSVVDDNVKKSDDTKYTYGILKPFSNEFLNDLIYYWGFGLLYATVSYYMATEAVKVIGLLLYNIFEAFDFTRNSFLAPLVKDRVILAAQQNTLQSIMYWAYCANKTFVAGKKELVLIEHEPGNKFNAYQAIYKASFRGEEISQTNLQAAWKAYINIFAASDLAQPNLELTNAWRKFRTGLGYWITLSLLGYLSQILRDGGIIDEVKGAIILVTLVFGFVNGTKVAEFISKIANAKTDPARYFFAHYKAVNRAVIGSLVIIFLLSITSVAGIFRSTDELYEHGEGWEFPAFGVLPSASGAMINNTVGVLPLMASAMVLYNRVMTFVFGFEQAGIRSFSIIDQMVEKINELIKYTDPEVLIKELQNAEGMSANKRALCEKIPGFRGESQATQYEASKKSENLSSTEETPYNLMVGVSLAATFSAVFFAVGATALFPQYGAMDVAAYYLLPMVANIIVRTHQMNNEDRSSSRYMALTLNKIMYDAFLNACCGAVLDKVICVWLVTSLKTRACLWNFFDASLNTGFFSNETARGIGSAWVAKDSMLFFNREAKPAAIEARNSGPDRTPEAGVGLLEAGGDTGARAEII